MANKLVEDKAKVEQDLADAKRRENEILRERQKLTTDVTNLSSDVDSLKGMVRKP